MINFDFVWKLMRRDTDINQHLLMLYGIVVGNNAQTVVEIGAGQSTFVLTAAVNKTEGDLYSLDFLPEAVERLFPEGKGILAKESRYHFIAGSSQETGKTWGKPIDVLFIDSGHTYDLTTAELELFYPHLVHGGYLILHDTHPNWSANREAITDFFVKQQNYELFELYNQNGLSIVKKL